MNKDKNIMQYNEKSQRHGLWERYWDDILWYKGFYQNGKPLEYEENYWYNGKISKKRYYL